MPSMTDNPFWAIKQALWRKIDDSGPGGGAELLRQWALDHNPAQGLTAFRDDDSETGGFPVDLRSGESPALYIGSRASQQYDFAPGRFIDFPELFEVVGVVASRSGEHVDQFLWLVLRALWWDYPRLLDAEGIPLPGIKAFTLFNVSRENKEVEGSLFRKFTLQVEVKFCVSLQTWEVS